jgi:hypothetical protein
VALVTFHATPDRKTWAHRPKGGGSKLSPYGETMTWRVVNPVILHDGESVEMDGFEAQWCLVNYPDSFTLDDGEANTAA